MKPVREIISREIIDDLWGAGYTILPRARHPDPFFVPPEMVPQGRSYQWMHLVHDKFHFESKYSGSLGWAPVPASRHDGYFMPAGHVGDIEVNGLGLFEKPKFEVDAERDANIAKAHKQVDDWKDKFGGEFSGEFKVGNEKHHVGHWIDATKTIEDVTEIPRELTPYIAQIFEERDSMHNDLVSRWNSGEALTPWQNAIRVSYEVQLSFNRESPLGPTLNRLILPKAIENIRQRITKETKSGQASEH